MDCLQEVPSVVFSGVSKVLFAFDDVSDFVFFGVHSTVQIKLG